MKEFNLEEARQGKPVCTRDGRKVRILCFDLKDNNFPICAAVEEEEGVEYPYTYNLSGKFRLNGEHVSDLMMAGKKHIGWVNIDSSDGIRMFVGNTIYSSEEAAKEMGKLSPNNYITTIKIEWEE